MFSRQQKRSAQLSKLSTLSTLAVLAGCHSRTLRENTRVEQIPATRIATPDKGQVLETNTPASPPALQNMQENVGAQLQAVYRAQFENSIALNAGLLPEQRTELVARLSSATATEHLARLSGKSSTSCQPTAPLAAPSAPTHACLVAEIFAHSFANAHSLKALLAADAALHLHLAARLEQVFLVVDSLPTLVFADLANFAKQVDQVSSFVAKIVLSLEKYGKELELLTSRTARVDLPFLARSFFANKKFLLTTSFQQGSIGTERVLNLDTVVVKLIVNSGRLVLLQDKEGLSAGDSAGDVVMGSYPIVASLTAANGDIFYQVDFSRPENLRYLRNAIASPQEDVNITAQVVVPSVFHAPKVPHAELGTGLYFTDKDQRFVLDQLVLLEGNKPIVEPTEADREVVVKDLLHPTFHLVQGLEVLNSDHAEFAKNQAHTSDSALETLTGSGAKDLTKSESEPFFTTTPVFFADSANLASSAVAVKKIQKFNRSKDLIFVLSANTPASAVPVLKSAVNSYAEFFEKTNAPEGQRAKILAYTNEEFVAYAKSNGLDYGIHNIAADPRINMISWDSDTTLGAAWATALTNPHSGEILSADIMLSGNLWARVGCMTQQKTVWARGLKKGMPLAELVPSDKVRQKWSRTCDLAMVKLGLTGSQQSNAGATLPAIPSAAPTTFEPGSTPPSDDSNLSLEEFPRYQALLNSVAQFNVGQLFKSTNELSKGFSDTVLLSDGKNTLKMKPECARHVSHADLENAAVLTGSGLPDFSSEFVASAEQAALAQLRAVVVHELGHLFGLRHNFIASTTPGSVKDASLLPVAISTTTDSVMDYNDYALDLDLGAMRDYSSPEGAEGKANFGIYDLLALNAIYRVNLVKPEMTSPTAFCTDQNVLPYGNCQRDDYGKNHLEYLMHQVNLDIGRLKIEGLPMDAGGGISLKARLSKNIKALALEWYVAQDKLSQKLISPEDREAALQTINSVFFAKEVKSNFVQKWQETYGMPIVGLWDLLKISEEGFLNPQSFLRKFDALIVRKTVNESFGEVLVALNKVRAAKSGDARYTSMIRDFKLVSGEEFKFRTLLLEHFSQSIIVPAGAPMPFTYFDGGVIKNGFEATLNGKPVVYSSTKPFFNHSKNAMANKIQIDGSEKGQPKDVAAVVNGLYTIGDLKLLASVVAFLDPYAADGAPLARLIADQRTLNCFSGAEVCADVPALVPEKDKAISVVGARLLSNLFGELIAFLKDPDASLADASKRL